MPNELETYYSYLKNNGADVAPTFDSFKKTLSDENSAKQYYQYLKDNKFDAPETYDSFANTLGLKKKDISQLPSNGGVVPTPFTSGLPKVKQPSEDTYSPLYKEFSGQAQVDLEQAKPQDFDPLNNEETAIKLKVASNALTENKPSTIGLNEVDKNSPEYTKVRTGLGDKLYKENPYGVNDKRYPQFEKDNQKLKEQKSIALPKMQTVGKYLSDLNITPEQINLPNDFNPDKILTNSDIERYNTILGIKKELYDKKTNDAIEATKYHGVAADLGLNYWRSFRTGLNEGVESTLRNIDGAEKFIMNDVIGFKDYGGGFKDLADYVKETAVEPYKDKNQNIWHATAGSIGSMIPFFMEMTLPIGEAVKIGQTTLKVPKMASIMFGQSFTDAYSKNENVATSFKEGGKGALTGYVFHGMGEVAGAVSNKIPNKIASGLTNVVLNSLGFSGYTAAELLAQGKPENVSDEEWNKTLKNETIKSGLLGVILGKDKIKESLVLGSSYLRTMNTSDASIKEVVRMNINPTKQRKILENIADLDKQLQTLEKSPENANKIQEVGIKKEALQNIFSVDLGVKSILLDPDLAVKNEVNSDKTETEKQQAIEKINKIVAENHPNIIKADEISNEIDNNNAKVEAIQSNIDKGIGNPTTNEAQKSLIEKKNKDLKKVQEEVLQQDPTEAIILGTEIPNYKIGENNATKDEVIAYAKESVGKQNTEKIEIINDTDTQKEVEDIFKEAKKENIPTPIVEGVSEGISEGVKSDFVSLTNKANKVETVDNNGLEPTKKLNNSINYIKELYSKEYGLETPKITENKDGIYIHTGTDTGKGKLLKLFIDKESLNNKEYVKQYLENSDDRIIKIVENNTNKINSEPKKMSETPTETQIKTQTNETKNKGQMETLLNEVETPPIEKSEVIQTNKVEKTSKKYVEKPISQIIKDEKRFQNRTTLDKEHVNSIAKEWNDNELDPVVIWKDNNGKSYLLAGHHRFEAAKQLGKKTIDAKYFKGSEKEAIIYAKEKSNANRIMEQPFERADVYRKLRESGKSAKEINNALSIEGKNKIFIENLSYLKKNGNAIENLKSFSKSGDRTTLRVIERNADFVGEARKRFKELTDEHENEIYDYIDKNTKITSKSEFIDLLNRRINGIEEFNVQEPLNLEHRIGRGSLELEVLNDIKELKSQQSSITKEIQKAQRTIQNKQERDIKITQLTKNYNDLQIKIGDAEKKLNSAKDGDKLQISIFDEINTEVSNGTIKKETVINTEQRTEVESKQLEPIIKAVESKEKHRKRASDKSLAETLSKTDNAIREITGEGKGVPEKAVEPKEQQIDKKAEAQAKISDALERAMGKLGVIKNITEQQKTTLIKDIKDIVDGITELTKIEIKEFIDNYLKAKTTLNDEERKYIVDKVVEAKVVEEPKTSGIKKALVSDEMINKVNLDKISDKELIELGGKIRETKEVDARNIVEEISGGEHRALQPKEVVALLNYKVELDNNLDNIYEKITKAKENGDNSKQLSVEAKGIEKQIEDYETMSLITAQQQSLAFRLRRYLLNREYDLQRQIYKYKAKNINGEIEPEVLAKFKENDAKLKDLEKRIAIEEEKVKQLEYTISEKNIIESIGRKTKDNIEIRSKRLADNIRKGKILRPEMFNSATPATIAWDGALETVAITIEKGGKLANAISEGIKTIKKSDWYKGLTEKDKKKAEDLFVKTMAENNKETKGVSVDGDGKIVITKSDLVDLIDKGFNTIEEWTTQLHKELVKDNPEITETQVRDAITGYGKQANLTQDEIDIQISQQKTIGKLLSALEDVVINLRNPKRTGSKRIALEEKARNLTKKIKEAMKNLPQSDADIETQWKSLLDKRKKQLSNDIESLDRQIEAGKRDVKNEKGIEYDEETRKLIEIRDAKKEELDVIDPIEKKWLTPEERVNRAITMIDKQIELLDKSIKNGDIERKNKGNLTPETPELKAKRELRDEKKKVLEQMRKESGMLETERIERSKKIVSKKIAELKEKLATQDFVKKQKLSPIEPDAELKKLKGEKELIQEDFDKAQYVNDLHNRTLSEKWRDRIVEAFGLTRIIAGIDLSAVGIQGLIRTVTRPKQALKAFPEMFKQMVSEERNEKFVSEFKTTDLYRIIKASGGYLSFDHFKFKAREEQFQSGWVNHIWNFIGRSTVGIAKNKSNMSAKAYDIWVKSNPYKAGQRAFEGYLNMMRIQAYSEYVNLLEKNGMTLENDPKAYKAMASWVNNATGRGKLMGSLESSADILTMGIFSPRKVAANFNVMNPRFYYKMYQRSPIMATQAMKNMLQFVGVLGTTIGLAILRDDKSVELDPRSSNYLKIKVGDKYVDLLAGHSQIIVLLNKIMSGELKTKTGEVKTLGGTYASATRKDVIYQFLESKASPSAGIILRFTGSKIDKEGNRKDAFGNDVTFKNELLRNTIPIWTQSLKDLYKEGDPYVNSGLLFFSIFGSNVQTPSAPKPPKGSKKTSGLQRSNSVTRSGGISRSGGLTRSGGIERN